MVKQAKDLEPGDVYNGRMISSVHVSIHMCILQYTDGGKELRSTDEKMLVNADVTEQLRSAFGTMQTIGKEA